MPLLPLLFFSLFSFSHFIYSLSDCVAVLHSFPRLIFYSEYVTTVLKIGYCPSEPTSKVKTIDHIRTEFGNKIRWVEVEVFIGLYLYLIKLFQENKFLLQVVLITSLFLSEVNF